MTKRLINPKAIAKALGAEATKAEIDTKRGPISLFSLQQFLVDRLRSTVDGLDLKEQEKNAIRSHFSLRTGKSLKR